MAIFIIFSIDYNNNHHHHHHHGQKSDTTWRTVMRAAGNFVNFKHFNRTKLYMRNVQTASVPGECSG